MLPATNVHPPSEELITELLASYEPISLAGLAEFRLLDRVDTKFVLRDWQLAQILRRLRNDYHVLATPQGRANHYQTLYFDSADFTYYTAHHNDRRIRHKVRCRRYVDSGLNFLEVKCKMGQGRTIKRRLETLRFMEELVDEAGVFVSAHSPVAVHRLAPVIWNYFTRVTLVSKYRMERLTLDVDYRHAWQGVEHGLPGIAIAEVKQQKFSYDSEFLRELRRRRIRSMGFSKYCTGIADLYPQVKYNRFKSRFLMLERLSRLEEYP